MQFFKLKFLMITMMLMLTTAYSATLTLTTKYSNSGGVAGDMNSDGDMVNGRVICDGVNDYNNNVAGCDMSADAGYNDNGTGDPSDDYYTGDLIVRTNDSFTTTAKYSWLGNAGGDEEQVTLTGVLPAGTGFIWDTIPGACDASGSSISADRKTIICLRKDFDTNDVGSYSELLDFPVKVEGDTPNGTVPGDVVFTISSPNATDVTDGVRDGRDENLIKVTASPRWNIDKNNGSSTGIYSVQPRHQDDQGNDGWYVYYKYHIEVDEVTGETDDINNPSLGNEALDGGRDATVTFVDDLSQISPNAKLVTWDDDSNFSPTNNPCDMDTYSNSIEPYPSKNATYPERSIPVDAGVMTVTCTQSGTDVNVEVKHIDGTLTDAPKLNRSGQLMPVTRKTAAIGVIKVFIPYDDVEKGADGVLNTDDDGELLTKNCMKEFDPKGISGKSNFGSLNESEKDNCYVMTLRTSSGSFSKTYRRGWSNQTDQEAEWNSVSAGDWWYAPTDASYVGSGDGTITPDGRWGTLVQYSNGGVKDIDNPKICDVIDTNTFEMEVLSDTDNPDTHLDDSKHAVDIEYANTWNVEGVKVQYAVGYVGTWPPDPDVVPGDIVGNECNDSSVIWYDDFVTAKAAADNAGKGVSKVRVTADRIKEGERLSLRIRHKARKTFLDDGTEIPNGTLLVNYAVYQSSLNDDTYMLNSYRPRTQDEAHASAGHGDRLILQKAKARILKQMSPTNVTPGDDVNVSLSPSFTIDTLQQLSDNVQVVDVLPYGLTYKNGTTVGAYGVSNTPYEEPVVYEATDANCNTYAAAVVAEGHPCGTLNGGTGKESILVWDLGTQETGTVFNDINFTTIVDVDAPADTLHNYAQIESPSDGSPAAKRVANANVNNSVPASLLIVKSVQTPRDEINKGSLSSWMKFRVGLRNGSAQALSKLDVIDIIPFNGDGVDGSFTFTPQEGITVDRKREPASNFVGLFQLDSVFFDDNGQCDASNVEFWFTNAAGPLDISPLASSNTKTDGTPEDIWCKGTTSGPDAGCGFTNAEVTAVRSRNVDMDAGGTCFLALSFATQDNVDGNIYSNTAGSNAVVTSDGSKLDGVLSNTVPARVYASSIGNKVWFDIDRDGIQADDGSEPGLDGITVNLYDGAGTLIATTQTVNGGLYTFENLVHGDYVVEVEPNGYQVTTKSAGGNTAIDSDINQDSNKTDTITLGEDEDIVDIDAGLTAPVISGNVFDDGDGDANVNGTAISQPSGTQLHVTLLDENGAVLATTPVAADGTYSFGGAEGVRSNTNYTVVLATTANATTSDLPENWNNTGENINSAGAGNDGVTDGKISVSVGTEDIPQIDFGINHKPTADDKTEASQLNPGGTTQVDVPTLTGADDESNTLIYTITELPTNATLYYDGNEITDPNFVVTDPSKLTVDPDDGDQTVVFKYTTTDEAGVISDPATVTMPFTNLVISGNIFDDGDGDANVNGTAISQPSGTQLHVTLLDENGAVLATTPVAADGTYSFDNADGVQGNTNYTVVLATTANATTSDLPENWNNTGENINSAGAGNDGVTDGKISVSVGTEDIPQIDFGINHKPTAADKTEDIQLNPGGTTQVTVPALEVADTEDGTPTTITIKTLPDNATLYYDGVAVTAGQIITSFDPNKLTVDPIDGDQTVVFDYTTTDAAGIESDVATVTMPFAGLGIAGTLYNDGNGNTNGSVDGTAINKPSDVQLYVNLVDVDGNVIASKPLAEDGTYQFIGTDGVTANTDYTVVLSTTEGTAGQPAPEVDLPANWNNTGENINSAGNGDDGDANGIIAVSLGTVAITEVDFGINHKPEASDVTEPAQANPSGDHQYPVPTLPVTDTEDGTPTTVTIKTLPDPETGVLYYDGTPVTEGQVIENFDPSKLTVDPTEGNPTMVFTYTTTDEAGVESDIATVTMPFLGDMYVGDRVWMDNNGNGRQDEGETGVAGVTVKIYSEDGTLVGTTETNSTGEYIFKIEEPGDYYIEFADDETYFTTACPTCTAEEDSDVTGSNNRTEIFTLTYGQTDLSHDAGIAHIAHIGDYFWIDENKNGIQDDNEQPVAGAIVELFDADGNPVTDTHGNHQVITDENGRYGFDVVPGEYQVRFTLPEGYEGYVFSDPDQGDDAADTDANTRGYTQTVNVEAGQQYVLLDAGINCGCSEVSSDSGDALSLVGMFGMMFMTIFAGLFFVRKEELQA